MGLSSNLFITVQIIHLENALEIEFRGEYSQMTCFPNVLALFLNGCGKNASCGVASCSCELRLAVASCSCES